MNIDAALNKFFMFGRMMCHSKGDYCRQYPKNVAVFNSNVCIKSQGKIWFGDLDITKDSEKLIELAKELGEDVYVLREMDARFNNEKNPAYERAIAKISKDGIVEVYTQ